MKEEEQARILFSRDSTGKWFIRHVCWIVEDAVHGELRYHCDENLGGPFDTLALAAKHVGIE